MQLGPFLLGRIAYFKIVAGEVSTTSGVRWNCTCLFAHQGTKDSIVAANCSTSCDCEHGNCHLILFWFLVCTVRVKDVDLTQYLSIITFYTTFDPLNCWWYPTSFATCRMHINAVTFNLWMYNYNNYPYCWSRSCSVWGEPNVGSLTPFVPVETSIPIDSKIYFFSESWFVIFWTQDERKALNWNHMTSNIK